MLKISISTEEPFREATRGTHGSTRVGDPLQTQPGDDGKYQHSVTVADATTTMSSGIPWPDIPGTIDEIWYTHD